MTPAAVSISTLHGHEPRRLKQVQDLPEAPSCWVHKVGSRQAAAHEQLQSVYCMLREFTYPPPLRLQLAEVGVAAPGCHAVRARAVEHGPPSSEPHSLPSGT